MFIYVIVCSETQKIYVGQHKGFDLGKYLSKKWYDAHRYARRSHLYNAMRSHPRDSWSIHPLVSGIENKKELDELERLLIYALKSQHPEVGYNICDGGEGFIGPHTEEWKQNLSARLMGHVVSEETRKKISAANTGRQLYPRTPENETIRLAALKQAGAEGKMSHGNGMRGKTHSEHTLTKMSESAKKRGISPETQQKMLISRVASGWGVGHPSYTTPEGIEKMRAAKKGKPWPIARLMRTIAWG